MRLLMLTLTLAMTGCGSSTITFSDGGSAAGGSAAGGSAAGGSAAGGSAAGGSAAGGSAAGGSADGGAIQLNGADTCSPSAPDVTAGGVFLGSTFFATDDYSVSGANCPSGGAASGRDVAYRLAPPVARTYRVKVTPLDRVLPDGGVIRFDPMLYVQATCGAGPCVTGTILNGVGQPEEVTFSLAANQEVYVVVDGELASRGDFQLEVSF